MIATSKADIRTTFIVVSLLMAGPVAMVCVGFKVLQPRAEEMWCQENLRTLDTYLALYAKENQSRYPPAPTWCDALVTFDRHGDVARYLVCKTAGPGKCHYAMNPDATAGDPQGLVWLFETNAGWNQYGGPELLTSQHHRGRGANVLFDDGHVEFVRVQDWGQLRWRKKDETPDPPATGPLLNTDTGEPNR